MYCFAEGITAWYIWSWAPCIHGKYKLMSNTARLLQGLLGLQAPETTEYWWSGCLSFTCRLPYQLLLSLSCVHLPMTQLIVLYWLSVKHPEPLLLDAWNMNPNRYATKIAFYVQLNGKSCTVYSFSRDLQYFLLVKPLRQPLGKIPVFSKLTNLSPWWNLYYHPADLCSTKTLWKAVPEWCRMGLPQ